MNRTSGGGRPPQHAGGNRAFCLISITLMVTRFVCDTAGHLGDDTLTVTPEGHPTLPQHTALLCLNTAAQQNSQRHAGWAASRASPSPDPPRPGSRHSPDAGRSSDCGVPPRGHGESPPERRGGSVVWSAAASLFRVALVSGPLAPVNFSLRLAGTVARGQGPAIVCSRSPVWGHRAAPGPHSGAFCLREGLGLFVGKIGRPLTRVGRAVLLVCRGGFLTPARPGCWPLPRGVSGPKFSVATFCFFRLSGCLTRTWRAEGSSSSR